MHYDALIIGAGLSGLSAGLRLALYGKKVRIFERHCIAGGLNSYYRKGGGFLDVGLHAVTNYAPEDLRSATLNKILRQLRIRRGELDLRSQLHSEIIFPQCTLRLDNDFDSFRSEIGRAFPAELGNFDRMVGALPQFDAITDAEDAVSARAVLESEIREPLLREMLLCPVMFYGNPSPRDMSYGQFAIMFRSVIMEGMCRPLRGMKSIIELLVSRFTALGGELSLGNGIASMHCEGGRVQSITDSTGEIHTANAVISDAGALETAALCDAEHVLPLNARPGEMAFLEAIFNLDCTSASLGIDQTVIFRSTEDRLFFDIPGDDFDCRSHILCLPGNFEGCAETGSSSSLRVTVPASAKRWAAKDSVDYRASKQRAVKGIAELAEHAFPQIKGHILSSELFTPITIRRFTGHINGAVYGSPCKMRSGRTLLENLFICGTDQGLLGIVGALTSGIVIANSYALK